MTDLRTTSAHQRADRRYGEQPRRPYWNSHGSLSPNTRIDGEHDNATDFAQEARRLWQDLPAHNVLFYPLGDLDSALVSRAGQLADVFVVCDWRWPCSPDGFDVMVGQLMNDDCKQVGVATLDHQAGHRSFELPVEQVQAITGPSEDFGLFREPAWVARQQPWGRIARLHQPSSESTVWLIYITGNAVEIYKHLFLERGAAPRVLWLDFPLGVDADRWAEFVSPAGELGHVFISATRQPRYVAAQRRHPGWKQSIPCQRLPAWHPAWDMNLFTVPDLPMGDGGGIEFWR